MGRNKQVIRSDWLAGGFEFSTNTAIFSIGWYIERQNIDAAQDRLDLSQ